jgi:hypothetical protein
MLSPAFLETLMKHSSLPVHRESAMNHEQSTSAPSFWRSPVGIVCTLIAIAASVYLWFAHQDRVLALLPYALLAACPLMHMFMHHGHGGHRHGTSPEADERVPRNH